MFITHFLFAKLHFMKRTTSKTIQGGALLKLKQDFVSAFVTSIVMVVLLAFGIFAMQDSATSAAPPSIMTYQGKILKSGASVTTTQAMGFLIYDALTDGNILYTASGTIGATSTVSVGVSQGLFSVNFGGTGTNSLPASMFATNTALYLEVWINESGSYTKLTPRKRLTAAPYALNSQYLLGYSPAASSTSQYIPVSDTNGNLAFSGTPQSSGVSGGVIYINPGSADANETLLGVALGGSERFRVDEDGDTWIAGALSVTSTLSAATSTLAELTITNGVTIGGVRRTSWPSGGGGGSSVWSSSTGRVYPATVTDVVLVGKNTTSSDSTIFEVSGASLLDGNVTLGTGSTLTLSGTLTQTGSTSLATTTATNLTVSGASTFATSTFNNGLARFWDTARFDGNTLFYATTTFYDVNTFYGTSTFAEYTSFSETAAFSATTTIGTNKLVYNPGTGYIGINTSTPSAQFAVDGNGYLKGTYDITADLRVLDDLYVGSRTESITTSTFALDGDDAYIADLLGVGDSIFVENALHIGTSSLHLTGSTATGGFIRMDGGPLVIDSASTLGINSINNQNIVTGSGNFGINSSTPGYTLSVQGQAYVSATATANELVANAITLAGVRRTSWPSGGSGAGTTTNNIFTGTNTFRNQLTIEGQARDPQIKGSITNASLLDEAQDIDVNGDYAYVYASGTVSAIDITDPDVPSIIGSYSTTSFTPKGVIAVKGAYVFVRTQSNDIGQGLMVLDFSNPNNPLLLETAKIRPGGFSVGFEGDESDLVINGSRLYAGGGFGDNDLDIVDISDVRNIRLESTASVNITGGARAMDVTNELIVAFSDFDSAIFVLNTEGESLNDEFSDTDDGYAATNGVVVRGNLAYSVSGNAFAGGDSLVITDISDPTDTSVLASVSSSTIAGLENASDIDVVGDFAYVVSETADALVVIDISSSTNPTHVKTISTTSGAAINGAKAIHIQGNYAYVVANDGNSFQIFDLVGAKITSAEIGNAKISRLDVGGHTKFTGPVDIGSGLAIGGGGLGIHGDFGMTSLSTSTTAVNKLTFSNQAQFLSNTTSTGGTYGFIFDTTYDQLGSILAIRDGGTEVFTVTGNSRVGINSSTPSATFVVEGDALVTATLTARGNIVGQGQLTVQSTSTLQGDVTIGQETSPEQLLVWGDLYAGSDNEFITSSTFALTGDDAYIHDLLGVGDSIFVENAIHIGTSSLHLSGDTTGGLIRMDGGPLTLDSSGQLNINTTNNQNVIFGSGNVGIASSSPGYLLSVGGNAFLSGTLDVSGLATVSSLAVTGQSTLSATTTFSAAVNVNDKLTVQGAAGSPVVLATYAGIAGSTEEITYGEGYFFVRDSNIVRVVDVSNPRQPVDKAVIDTGALVTDIKYANGYLYVGGTNNVRMYDMRRIEDISLINTFVAGGTEFTVAGNYLYGFDGTNFRVTDITAAENERVISTTSFANSVRDVEMKGNYLYVTYNAAAVAVFDVADPATPVLVSTIAGSGGRGLDVANNLLYIGDSDVLKIYNIASSTNPVLLDSYDWGSDTMHDVKVSGNYAYVVGGSNFTVFDVSNPASISHVATSTPAGVAAFREFVMSGNQAFLTDTYGSDTVLVIDLGGITAPNAMIGHLQTNDTEVFGDAFIQGRTFVGAGLSVANGGLLVGGDFGMFSTASSSSAYNEMNFSQGVRFRTATLTSDVAFVFDTEDSIDLSSSKYLLSIRNNGTATFSVATNGDVHTTGTYYGEAVAVSTPGAPGDLAEKVDIALNESVEPGDVMIVDTEANDRYRKSIQPMQTGIAGVIATNPTIVIGSGKTENQAELTMVGRVPVKVSDENGAIVRGDLLVSGSKPGMAMRFDPYQDTGVNAVGVIGVALEPLAVNEGKVMALVRSGYINTRTKTLSEIQQDLLALAQSEGIYLGTSAQDLSVNLSPDGELNNVASNQDLEGSYLINVAGLLGDGGAWEVDEGGRFITKVATSEGTKELYALQSESTEYVFSGNGTLEAGQTRIEFDAITQELIDKDQPIKVSVTLTSEANGIFVESKDGAGFTVKELQSGSSNATFDWVVIAQRKLDGDADESSEEIPEPEEEETLEESSVPKEPAQQEEEPEIVEELPEENAEEPEAIEEISEQQDALPQEESEVPEDLPAEETIDENQEEAPVEDVIEEEQPVQEEVVEVESEVEQPPLEEAQEEPPQEEPEQEAPLAEEPEQQEVEEPIE